MNVTVYKAFIASPSDTSQEREICERIFDEINSGLGEIYSFRIESLKWENNVRPVIQNKDGQEIILEQIGEYDLFIGIMNKKFGTPTPRAGSGTEEEFESAFERYNSHKNIEVMFYFNDEPPLTMSELNIEEWSKILKFKKKLQGLGIYGQYNGISDFETKVRKHISKHFIERYKLNLSSPLNSDQIINKEALRKILNKRFNDSLKGFDDQPRIWTEPVISRTNEISQNPDENYSQRVIIEEILVSDKSYFINAPSQFGLTTLSHYLVLEAWEHNELWIYLDNSSLKLHKINNAVKNEVSSLDQKIENVKCIVFDSYISKDKVSVKKLKALIDANPNLRIIVMNSVDETLYLNINNEEIEESEDLEIEKEFTFLHLIALPRNQIRDIVSQYNKEKKIGDDNTLLDKVTNELECLNLHRTPYNILTILKVSEKHFDDSPVNRTKMIELILLVLFDLGEIPRYKTKPDVKDCEYVLGRFCEILLRKEKYLFSKEEFLGELYRFCKEKYIELELEVVFEVLRNNNIIISDNQSYRFKTSFWVYYFGARRMRNDEEFRKFIFEAKRYSAYPEMIEFYTGIDRNRDDALNVLLDDIKSTKKAVEEKLGIKGEINLLDNAKWKPTEVEIEKIQDEIGDNVLTSNLPDNIKDQYLDKSYNQIRPYNQSIQKFFEEYSLHNLMQLIRASSTALRNSDYADPEIKKQLLIEIYSSWNELAKVLFVLSPIMASKGTASFEGADFELYGNFGDTFEERLNIIIQVLPANIVGFFKNELYSPKIAPLLFERFNNETNELMKHHQALLLIYKRPKGWKKQIEDYIVGLNKNSFYLFNTVNSLRSKYRYDFALKTELEEMKYLVKLGLAKHEFGGTKPNYLTQIKRISDDNLPKREYFTEE